MGPCPTPGGCWKFGGGILGGWGMGIPGGPMPGRIIGMAAIVGLLGWPPTGMALGGGPGGGA